ncbi:DUF2841 domain-containing protein [Aspergillus mulundensis]|uniref:Subtelomeric hrmA-associated cluster protein AFUB-079030/YDR124W-like helical bundle domain-containing protein n=1 Tax=Aspergillus mulundensis TaxID=1810919 RepID=A0A3D8SJZ9_9EURO|nr:Uncharacterized protein DSM5745_03299 [Aspergillus mulundensis]RDW86657.1 Uncharacterized protein DSM5745_03299 [Aspergillus mulundensis]
MEPLAMGVPEVKGEEHGQMAYHDMAPQTASNELQSHQPAQFALPYSHFAIMFIDQHGELQAETSPCIAGCEKVIFTDEVRQRFLKLVNKEWQPGLQDVPGMALSAASWYRYHATQHPPDSLIPYEWQPPRYKRHRHLRRVNPDDANGWLLPSPAPSLRCTTLRVGQTQVLRKYYDKAFEDLKQLSCRVVAKAWVKLVEPRKQVNFPYNGKAPSSSRLPKPPGQDEEKPDPEKTKPTWWPTGVRHKEPDHLPKPERIRLLKHILCNLKDSHDVTAAKLIYASLDVRSSIESEKQKSVLDEVLYVRSMEERYLDGEINGDTVVHVYYGHMEEEPETQGADSDRLEAMMAAQTNQQPTCRSYRSMPIITQELPHRPLRNGKRPADSECYRPISPVSAGSRDSSMERSLATYPPDVKPSMLQRTEPARGAATPQSLPPAGPTSLPDLYAHQFAAQPQTTHPGFWDTLAAPSAHPQFSFNGY